MNKTKNEDFKYEKFFRMACIIDISQRKLNKLADLYHPYLKNLILKYGLGNPIKAFKFRIIVKIVKDDNNLTYSTVITSTHELPRIEVRMGEETLHHDSDMMGPIPNNKIPMFLPGIKFQGEGYYDYEGFWLIAFGALSKEKLNRIVVGYKIQHIKCSYQNSNLKLPKRLRKNLNWEYLSYIPDTDVITTDGIIQNGYWYNENQIAYPLLWDIGSQQFVAKQNGDIIKLQNFTA